MLDQGDFERQEAYNVYDGLAEGQLCAEMPGIVTALLPARSLAVLEAVGTVARWSFISNKFTTRIIVYCADRDSIIDFPTVNNIAKC